MLYFGCFNGALTQFPYGEWVCMAQGVMGPLSLGVNPSVSMGSLIHVSNRPAKSPSEKLKG